MQTSLESIVQDFYCMHQLDPLKWTAYYSGVTICHEYRYGYIYMYSWIIKMRTFFVIGDWFIQSYKYIILNSILLSQLLFFRYFACLQSTLRRCTLRQTVWSCNLSCRALPFPVITSLCISSTRWFPPTSLPLPNSKSAHFAADSQKDPLMMIPYD